jgi:hypothetical protein
MCAQRTVPLLRRGQDSRHPPRCVSLSPDAGRACFPCLSREVYGVAGADDGRARPAARDRRRCRSCIREKQLRRADCPYHACELREDRPLRRRRRFRYRVIARAPCQAAGERWALSLWTSVDSGLGARLPLEVGTPAPRASSGRCPTRVVRPCPGSLRGANGCARTDPATASLPWTAAAVSTQANRRPCKAGERRNAPAGHRAAPPKQRSPDGRVAGSPVATGPAATSAWSSKYHGSARTSRISVSPRSRSSWRAPSAANPCRS